MDKKTVPMTEAYKIPLTGTLGRTLVMANRKHGFGEVTEINYSHTLRKGHVKRNIQTVAYEMAEFNVQDDTLLFIKRRFHLPSRMELTAKQYLAITDRARECEHCRKIKLCIETEQGDYVLYASHSMQAHLEVHNR